MVSVFARPMAFLLLATLLLGCGVSTASGDSAPDAIDATAAPDVRDTQFWDAGPWWDDAPTDNARDVAIDTRDASPNTQPAASNIAHVIVIVQENHTFDAYFGRYCTAAAGSAPTCTHGPECCESAPAAEPAGHAPAVLDDAENANYDPDHTQACEVQEINGGAMDHFTQGPSCADARNFAIAPDSTVSIYHDYAQHFAIADRYFQPIIGQSSSNDMYFATARMVFIDNQFKPDTIGHNCTLPSTTTQYANQTTIADVLINGGVRFAYYAEGYAAMKAATLCPGAPSDCPFGLPIEPCDYDPSDVPFEYYQQFADNPQYMKDYQDFVSDVANETLPDVAFIKPVGYHNEHPGYGTRISDGAHFVDGIVQSVLNSPAYAHNTLILITWDEGGGFFDHVPPPADASSVDHQHSGTRIPLIAVGPFARTNYVSHVVMEHSSIVRFLEFNFTGTTGQLGARDAVANNIGSLLDPATTGIAVPEN